tara:strand:- start:11605 stop:13131 length:1527 start_codon:yes stop_codon:yes gene_type:complete
MNDTKRIVLNTGFLYGKMLISMFIALYSTRIVLNALGVEDFGIFNLVAGVIAMLSFLNSAMTTATQRYLSFSIGTKEEGKINSVFKSSVILHLIIGAIIVIILEVAGIFLFDGFLNIPENRIATAKAVYHFMVISTFFTINAVPYDAAIIAHENLLFDAIVGIIESILKLAIAIILTFSQNDRLILYGMLMAGLIIFTRIIKSIYCYSKYSECKHVGRAKFDVSLIKEMFSFARWNLFGALCVLGRSQGIAILLNVFFGTIVNAAYAISNQVANQMIFFSASLLRAMNPQIMKSEGMNDRQRMLRLSMMASKFGFFMVAFIAIPSLFEMSEILKLWLKTVPEHTVVFCSLFLITSLVNQTTVGLQSAIQATGKIKLYQTIVGGTVLLNVPLAYLLLKFELPPYSVLIGSVVLEILACTFRLIILKRIAGLSINEYFERVILKEVIPIFVITITCWLSTTYLTFNLRFLVTFSFSIMTFFVSIYFTGLDNDEKQYINSVVQKKLKKLKK